MNRFQAAVVAVVLAVGMFCLAEITTAKAAPTPTPQTNASPGSKQAEPKADPGVATNQAASGQGEKFSDEEYGWLYEEVTATEMRRSASTGHIGAFTLASKLRF